MSDVVFTACSTAPKWTNHCPQVDKKIIAALAVSFISSVLEALSWTCGLTFHKIEL